MSKKLQIINWNFRYMGAREKKLDFLFSIAKGDYCIMLQEVEPYVCEKIRERCEEEHAFVYSLDYRAPGKFDSTARKLGVLMICSKNIKVLKAGVVERNLFPDRTAWAVVDFYGRQVKLLAIHSITGCGYGKAKSIQYESLMEFVEDFRPDVIGIDANEPQIDSYDIEKMQFYNQNGYGAVGFFREMRNCGLLDSFVVANNITDCQEGQCLAVSYYIRRKGGVRYDFIFTKNTIKPLTCKYLYEEAIEATGDHALIVSELELNEEKRI